MLIKKATISAVSLGLAVFSAALIAQDLDVNAAHVVVEGPENRVHEFHQGVKSILSAILVEGIEGAAGISCNAPGRSSCDDFKHTADDDGAAVAIYIIHRELEHLTAFLLSWRKLQDRQLADVSVKFDMKDLGSEDNCTLATVAKQPCKNAPQCAFTVPIRCDKVIGAPCTSCGRPGT